MREKIPLPSLHAWVGLVGQMHHHVVGSPVDIIPTVLLVATVKHSKFGIVSFAQADSEARS